METYLIIKKLINIYSPSGQEGAILEWIGQYLNELGIKTYSQNWGIAACLKGEKSDTGIIFNAHVDTVPIGDEKLWNYPALSGILKGGKVFGVGASDMKAAAASLLLMAGDMTQNVPNCDVWLTFVKNEEVDGSGTKEFVQWFKKTQMNKYIKLAALIGEPTGLSKIEIGHKGNIFLKVTTIGKGGHGSKPINLTEHAVFKMFEIAKSVELWSKKLKNTYKGEDLGVPTVGIVTAIEAGKLNTPNKFPDSCEATFDIRTTPKSHKKLVGEFTQVVKKLDPEAKIDYVYEPVSFGYTNKNHNFIKMVKKIANVNLSLSKGSTDMCFFTAADIPTIIFGPGETSCIHGPNEYCIFEKIDKCKEIYIKIINEFGSKI